MLLHAAGHLAHGHAVHYLGLPIPVAVLLEPLQQTLIQNARHFLVQLLQVVLNQNKTEISTRETRTRIRRVCVYLFQVANEGGEKGLDLLVAYAALYKRRFHLLQRGVERATAQHDDDTILECGVVATASWGGGQRTSKTKRSI